MQLIECVPNFSEGRNLSSVESISRAIVGVKGVHLLDVDSNASANRTVMTFVGEAGAVCEAAFQAIAVAQSLIDMRSQRGAHPRIGATDVCPLVPLADASMQQCIELSHKLSARVASELEIPVYLYAKSAKRPERRKLAFLRKGQYEALKKRIEKENFAPDYGPNIFNARAGATAIGARDLLIAFNINLATTSREIAEKIARQIRRAREEDQVGALPECTALGWYIEEYKCAQVSMNIMDYRKTSLHGAFLEVKRLATELETSVTGSEVIGLLPLQPLLETGRYCLGSSKNKESADQLISEAIDFLNLGDTRPFDPQKKVLDYRLQNLPPLRNMTPSS
ncbi:MAG: glutamate formimidoyltransferase [Candidatus Melainabacteria bacterium]|nr:MAG: glutamate formimidoyltransferase [Candidatus Melainabacteria bacterium]